MDKKLVSQITKTFTAKLNSELPEGVTIEFVKLIYDKGCTVQIETKIKDVDELSMASLTLRETFMLKGFVIPRIRTENNLKSVEKLTVKVDNLQEQISYFGWGFNKENGITEFNANLNV